MASQDAYSCEPDSYDSTLQTLIGQYNSGASEGVSLGPRNGENDIVVTLRHVMFAHLARALGAWWLQSLEACEPALGAGLSKIADIWICTDKLTGAGPLCEDKG